MNTTRRTLDIVEQELSKAPALHAPPPGMRRRIMEALAETTPQPASQSVLRFAAPLAAAASIALIAAVWTMSRGSAPEPFTQVEETAVIATAGAVAPAPGPIIRPAAAFVVGTLERPLVKEGRHMLEDTRRAADFVVSCLPFTGG